MVSAYRVTVLAAAAVGSLPVHASATTPRLLRGLADADDGATPHYWVSPLIDDPIDKACYRRTYRGRPCPRGYDWDGALACWAQCPLEYPVECGAECLQHNRVCTKEILDKAGAVATTALNALTAGVFGQLAATSHAVKLGVTCTNKMLPAVRHIVEFVASSATTPTAQDAQFKQALNEQDFFTKDLPAAIAVCMDREPPSSAGPSAPILKVMQTIVDKAIESKRKGESILRDGSFLDFLDVVGLGFSRERQRQLCSAFGWDDAKSFVESGVSCGQNIKSVVDNITDIVKKQKQVDSSSTLQSIRFAVMNSDVFLRELPDTVLGCANASTPDAARLRGKILKTTYAIVDQVLDAAVTPSGKPRSASDFLVAITDMGLDALSSFDPTGLASMVKEFVQPICNPTIFPRSIDDGPANDALGLRTVETAFAGSSGHWYTTEPDPATDTESTVQIIFRSTDDRDVTVEIESGGNDYDKVKVPSGKTVTWSKPLAELQAKTIYMVRSRPGFLWIKGTGGGSLLAWIPEVPIAGTGTVKLDIKINPPSEKEEMVSLALLEEARAEAAVARRNSTRDATTRNGGSGHDGDGSESIGVSKL